MRADGAMYVGGILRGRRSFHHEAGLGFSLGIHWHPSFCHWLRRTKYANGSDEIVKKMQWLEKRRSGPCGKNSRVWVLWREKLHEWQGPAREQRSFQNICVAKLTNGVGGMHIHVLPPRVDHPNLCHAGLDVNGKIGRAHV